VAGWTGVGGDRARPDGTIYAAHPVYALTGGARMRF
jgi:hypothetical protein